MIAYKPLSMEELIALTALPQPEDFLPTLIEQCFRAERLREAVRVLLDHPEAFVFQHLDDAAKAYDGA